MPMYHCSFDVTRAIWRATVNINMIYHYSADGTTEIEARIKSIEHAIYALTPYYHLPTTTTATISTLASLAPPPTTTTPPATTRRVMFWSPQEDEILRQAVHKHGQQWKFIANHVNDAARTLSLSPFIRNGNQCRERYVNHLDPNLTPLKKWTPHEDNLLLSLYDDIGSKWSQMTSHFVGRSENMIKNRFHSITGINSMRKKERRMKIKMIRRNFEQWQREGECDGGEGGDTHEGESRLTLRIKRKRYQHDDAENAEGEEDAEGDEDAGTII